MRTRGSTSSWGRPLSAAEQRGAGEGAAVSRPAPRAHRLPDRLREGVRELGVGTWRGVPLVHPGVGVESGRAGGRRVSAARCGLACVRRGLSLSRDVRARVRAHARHRGRLLRGALPVVTSAKGSTRCRSRCRRSPGSACSSKRTTKLGSATSWPSFIKRPMAGLFSATATSCAMIASPLGCAASASPIARAVAARHVEHG